ncbi:MAG: hypothetical protein Q9209_002411 [Squamulea sp. 1 TL-2023]
MAILLCDISLTESRIGVKELLDLDKGLLKTISKCFNYFRRKNKVIVVEHSHMEEFTRYDMTRSNEVYLEQHRGEVVCPNCNQPGQKASQCQAPKDPSRPAPVRPCKIYRLRIHQTSDCPNVIWMIITMENPINPEDIEKLYEAIACAGTSGRGHSRKDCPIPRARRWGFARPGKGIDTGDPSDEPLAKEDAIPKMEVEQRVELVQDLIR